MPLNLHELEKPAPLTDYQKTLLGDILGMTLDDADEAVRILLRPAKILREKGVDESDIRAIVEYGNYVWNLTVLRIMEQWEEDQELE